MEDKIGALAGEVESDIESVPGAICVHAPMPALSGGWMLERSKTPNANLRLHHDRLGPVSPKALSRLILVTMHLPR